MKHQLGMVLTMFEQTIGALDESLLLVEQKDAKPEDIQRLRSEITHARSIVKAFEPMAYKTPLARDFSAS